METQSGSEHSNKSPADFDWTLKTEVSFSALSARSSKHASAE